MESLVYTLVGDGSSDRRLMAVIDWTLGQLTDCLFTGQWADTRVLPPLRDGLASRVNAALEYFPCDILFVHRDAEGADRGQRCKEIASALAGRDGQPWVSVVPVRMQEAWFLIDENAIRTAAGNPRGTTVLDLPSPAAIEGISDPKEHLHALLRAASEHTGRRLKKFNPGHHAHRLAELITDFSPLRRLDAFAQFERQLQLVLEDNGWNHCGE